ncbi:MAG: tetratricopeptide repeat protein [Planctomycetes bacterium]|nr:tetratricopeptide repeat protein [Planctomycetota bacterium]
MTHDSHDHAAEADDAWTPSTQVGKGLSAIRRGDFVRARACFEAAREANPEDHDAVMLLAHVHRQEGRFDEAVKAFCSLIPPLEAQPEPDFELVWQLDEGLAETLVDWAYEVAGAGYTPVPTNRLLKGLGTYLKTFDLHKPLIEGVQAKVLKRAEHDAVFEPAPDPELEDEGPAAEG